MVSEIMIIGDFRMCEYCFSGLYGLRYFSRMGHRMFFQCIFAAVCQYKCKELICMAETTVTESNFEQDVLKSDKPVLVDFWASWCGPCRMLAPILSEIAAERSGSIKVGKVNVDEQPGLAAKYRVASIPMLVLFVGGKAVRTTVGYQTKPQLEAFIDGKS